MAFWLWASYLIMMNKLSTMLLLISFGLGAAESVLNKTSVTYIGTPNTCSEYLDSSKETIPPENLARWLKRDFLSLLIGTKPTIHFCSRRDKVIFSSIAGVTENEHYLFLKENSVDLFEKEISLAISRDNDTKSKRLGTIYNFQLLLEKTLNKCGFDFAKIDCIVISKASLVDSQPSLSGRQRIDLWVEQLAVDGSGRDRTLLTNVI